MTVVTGDKELDRYFATLTPKLQRGAIRKGVRAAGSAQVKEIRSNVKTMVGSDQTGRLRKSLGQRAWSRPKAGVIGTVVGPRYPDGAHGHLVEFGHEIVTKAGKNTGKRTRPIPFQRRAFDTGRAAVLEAQRKKLKQAIQAQRDKAR